MEARLDCRGSLVHLPPCAVILAVSKLSHWRHKPLQPSNRRVSARRGGWSHPNSLSLMKLNVQVCDDGVANVKPGRLIPIRVALNLTW